MKIFKVLLALLLVTQASFAVKILRPGDVVKGKKIDKLMFCYDEVEQGVMVEKFDRLKITESMITLQQEEIDVLKKRIQSVEETNEKLEKIVLEMKDLVKQAHERNNILAEEIKSQGKMIRQERAKSKWKQYTGVALGIASLIGGRYIATGH